MRQPVSRRPASRHLLSLALAAAFTTLTACGGGSSNSSSTEPTATDPTPAVTILTQPLDSQVTAGGGASFSVGTQRVAQGYQWQRSTDGGTTWAAIAGATAATLNLATVGAADNGHLFRVVISDAGVTTPSAAARLSVADAVVAPAISVGPADLQLTAGADAVFTTTATGTSLAYQWQRSSDGTTWTDIAGQTGASLTLAAVAVDSNGLQLRVVVRNSAGSLASAAALLSVQAASAVPAISSQPAAVAVVAPAPATFSVVASGQPAPSFQWQRSTDGGTTFTDIPGATAASHSTGPTSLADNGQRLRVLISNSAGSVLSQAQTLSVSAAVAAPAITLQPQDQRVNAGQTVTLTTTASGTPTPTLQWQLSTDGGSTWANIVGATASTYAFTAAAGDDGRRLRVVATNSSSSATSRAALLTVALPVSPLAGRAWTAGQRLLSVDPTGTAIDQAINSRLLIPSLLQSAIDQQGRVTTLFVQQVGGRAAVLATRTTPGSAGASIATPVVLDAAAPAQATSGLTLAVSPGGNAVAGWSTSAACTTTTYATTGACGYLYTARYLAATGRWEAPVLVGDTPTPGITLAINDAGDVAALYYSVKPTVTDIVGVQSVVAWRGADQSAYQGRGYPIDLTNGTFLPAALHIDAAGRFTFAGRLQNGSTNTDAAAVRGSVAGGAGAVEVVDQRGASVVFDGLFGNSAGQQVLMWHQDNGTRISQYAATLDSATGSWQVADLGTPAQTASVVPGALAEDGSFQWYSLSTLRCSTQRRVAGVWGSETALPAALCQGAPTYALARNGDLLAVRTTSTTAGQWLTFDARLQQLVHAPAATPLPADHLFGMQGTLTGTLLLGGNGIGAFISPNTYEVLPTPAAPTGDSRGLNNVWGLFLQ